MEIYGPALRYDPSHQVPVYCKCKMSVSPFSGGKHIKLFRRALLLEVSRVRDCLLPLRVLAVFRGDVLLWILCCVCFTYIQPANFGVHTGNSDHVSSLLCGCQVVVLHCRSILGVKYCSNSQKLGLYTCTVITACHDWVFHRQIPWYKTTEN